MNLHKHARLTPRGRALLVQRMLNGLRVEDASQAAGVSVRTAYKWLIAAIAASADLPKTTASAALDAFTVAITSALQRGESTTLVGFGTFEVKQRAAREGPPPNWRPLSRRAPQGRPESASRSNPQVLGRGRYHRVAGRLRDHTPPCP